MSSDFRAALLSLVAALAGGAALDRHMRHAGLASLHYERTAVAAVLGMPAVRARGAVAVEAGDRNEARAGSVLLASTAPPQESIAQAPLTLRQADEGPPQATQAEVEAAERRAAAARELRVCADPDDLPFSDRRGGGFENAVAQLIARDLGRTVRYTWWPQRRGFIRNTLNAGRCDVVMSVPAGYGLAQPTQPYYRSSYVFVTRSDRRLEIASLDDARLAHLTIGLAATGDGLTPAAQALALRGLIGNTRTYSALGDAAGSDPQRALIDAVARGAVDVAIAWGPLAGYYARRETVPLDLGPVPPVRELPALAMSFPICMGVRHGDDALEAQLDRAIARRRGDIQRLLASFGVPLLRVDERPLQAASLGTG